MQFLMGSKTAININGEQGTFFGNGRGVTQGDPLSPILLNFVLDSLSTMLDAAKQAGHIHGLVDHLIPEGVSFTVC